MRVSQLSRSDGDAVFGLIAAPLALERERPGDHADRQRAQLAGDAGDDGRTAGAGATPFAGGDEHHVRPAKQFFDLVLGVIGGLAPDFRVGAGAQPACGVAADVELDVGIAHQQRLRVGVDRDELHALEALLDHPVDGVDAAATDTHNLDDGQVIVRGGHHSSSSLVGSVLPLGFSRMLAVCPLGKTSTSTIGLELCQVVPRNQNGMGTTGANRAGAPTGS